MERIELDERPKVPYVKWRYRRGYRQRKRKYWCRKADRDCGTANEVVKEHIAFPEKSESANGVFKDQEPFSERSGKADGVNEGETSPETSGSSATERLSSPQHGCSSVQISNVDPADAEMDNDASLKSSGCDTSLTIAEYHPIKNNRNEAEISPILSASAVPEIDFTYSTSLGQIDRFTTPAAGRQKKKPKSRPKKRKVPLGLLKWRLSRRKSSDSSDLKITNLDPDFAVKDDNFAEKDNGASPMSSGCDTSLPIAQHRLPKVIRRSSSQPGCNDLKFSNLDPEVAVEDDNDASPMSSGCDTSLPKVQYHLPKKLRGKEAQKLKSLHQSSNPAEENHSLKKIVAKYKYFMCRLCLCKSGTMVDIHGCSVGSGYVPSALISSLLQFEVSVSDIYPQLVCLKCLKTLTVFQKFKDSCWKAKVKFDTLHFSMALPCNNDAGEMCDEEVDMAVNYEDSMETNEEYSDLCTEKEEEVITEIDIKEEPIEGSNIRDPLRLESPLSDVREILEEDITIKEEEIQISQRLSLEEVPVTLVEKTGKIAISQVNLSLEREKTQGPLFVKPTDTTSTKYACEDISSTKEANNNPSEITSKLQKENMVKETIVTSEFCKASSSSIFSFPDSSSVQPNLLGHIQSNTNAEKVGQYGENVVDGMQIRKEGNSLAVDKIMVGERLQNSAVDWRNQCKNIMENRMNTEENEGKTSSVLYFCKKCCKIFISMVELDNHTCTSEVKNLECTVCDKKFKTKNSLWNHIQKHNLNMRFYCQICCKGFLCEKELSRHFYFHKNYSPLQPVNSSSPNSSIPSGGVVNGTGQNQRKCDQKAVVPNSNDATNSKNKPVKISKLRLSKVEKACPVCNRIYCNTQYLDKHMLTQHSRTNLNWPKKIPTKKGADLNLIGQGDEDFFDCNVCGARFYMEDDLSIHMSVHARNNPFQCDCCEKKYNDKQLLWTHVAQCHNEKLEVQHVQ